jgi:hypothetical protein
MDSRIPKGPPAVGPPTAPPPGFGAPPVAPPVVAGRPRRWRPWLPLVGAGLAGAIVAAAATAALTGDDAGKVDTTTIELPVRVGDLRLRSEAVKDIDGDRADDFARRDENTRERGIDQVSTANNGAAVDVQIYADDELEVSATVVAVRAPSGGLFVAEEFPDPEDLALAVSRQVVVTDDDVACIATYERTLRPEDIDDGDEVPPPDIYGYCQRTDDRLTVVAQMSNVTSMRDAADIVNDAWSAVGGD